MGEGAAWGKREEGMSFGQEEQRSSQTGGRKKRGVQAGDGGEKKQRQFSSRVFVKTPVSPLGPWSLMKSAKGKSKEHRTATVFHSEN